MRADKYTVLNKTPDLYSDFNINFVPHPATKDLVLVKNEEAVKRSIRSLILTNSYERLNPRIGGNIRKYLFEPMMPETQKGLEEAIKLTIENYEPRAKLLRLIVTPHHDDNLYSIYIMFMTVNVKEPIEMNLSLHRVR